MKKLMLFAVAALMSFAVQAREPFLPVWGCDLQFTAHAKGLQVIVGKFDIKGRGTLHCASAFATRTIPVSINLSTKYLAPRVAFGRFDLYGESAHIGLFANDPEDLLGKYIVAQGQGALLAGGGVMTAVHASIPDIALNLSLQFVRGVGINVGVTTMTIRSLE